ncbi:hypothetical protein [Kocuria rhizophila]|uniref:Uncharacterized protein n=1 Tax=Kocuria rhizophila TaxID=72000 RepID=A0AAX2SGA2_KOCRH|nr:hypothetical protein [Kocuria rhizophila]MDR7374857.1 hypothetical protein [Kocuria rhizophila]TFI03126.1 hypothetical protein E4P33_00995 [Kocuria rhizophila]TFI05315.1 hypothetical protein E4P34_10160 [Kocuria rhizophila]
MDPVRTLVTAAAASYTANCALGGSVALGLLDTSNVRWVHHGLYIATSSLTAAACVAGLKARSTTPLALAPALAPLFLLQRHGARPLRRHTRDAIAAAPCYVAGLVLAWR